MKYHIIFSSATLQYELHTDHFDAAVEFVQSVACNLPASEMKMVVSDNLTHLPLFQQTTFRSEKSAA